MQSSELYFLWAHQGGAIINCSLHRVVPARKGMENIIIKHYPFQFSCSARKLLCRTGKSCHWENKIINVNLWSLSTTSLLPTPGKFPCLLVCLFVSIFSKYYHDSAAELFAFNLELKVFANPKQYG